MYSFYISFYTIPYKVFSVSKEMKDFIQELQGWFSTR